MMYAQVVQHRGLPFAVALARTDPELKPLGPLAANLVEFRRARLLGTPEKMK